jgi:SAM-dependent methyltransferase
MYKKKGSDFLKKQENKNELEYWKNLWSYCDMDFTACEDFWNGRADSFNQNLKDKEKKTSILIESMMERNILHHKAKVLDIGCGPGTHSIPMAEKCQEVFSMDISENMLKILQDKATKLGLENVHPMKVNWVDINLEEKQWDKKFDLVFASMSPAIHNYETLKKMCDASSGYCYLSAWVKRESKVEDALFNLINKEEGKTGILEDKIYYAFNILWNMGYYPEISYNERNWKSSQPLNEAFESYTKKLSIKNQISNEDKNEIKKYLEKIAEDGMIKEESVAVTGHIIWKV